MQQKITITEEQKKALAELDSLLAFGNSWITKIASDPHHIASLGDRKKLLLSVFIAAHSHVDAISYMLKSYRTHSSEVVLRSILESYVSAAYIVSVNNDSRATDYILTEAHKKLENYKKMASYREKHPGYNTEQDVYPDEEIQAGISQAEETIKAIKQKYPNARSVSTREKIAAVDTKFGQGKKHYRPIEWSYFHTYHILCTSSHVTFDSLFSLFVQRDGDTLSFYLGGNPKRVALLTLSAYVFYLDMLNMLLPRFGGKTGELKQFDDVLEKMKVLE